MLGLSSLLGGATLPDPIGYQQRCERAVELLAAGCGASAQEAVARFVRLGHFLQIQSHVEATDARSLINQQLQIVFSGP